MNRNRKSHWMAAAVVAVAMVAVGGVGVAAADGIGIPLPVDSGFGERQVGLGHNTIQTLDLGDLRRWIPSPLASGLPLIGRLTIGLDDLYGQLGLPVHQMVVND